MNNPFPRTHDDGKPWRIIFRALLISCFVMGICVAMTWWHLMPKGFPVTHARFWVNSVLPLVAAAACLLGIVATVRKWDGVLKCLVFAFMAIVVSAGIAGKCYFPQSVSGPFFIAIAACVVIALASGGVTIWLLRKTPVATWSKIVCIGAGIFLGVFLPWSQRAMDSATRPYCYDVLAPSSTLLDVTDDSLPLSDRVTVSPAAECVRLELNEATLDVYPLLSFRSRSPDRFWTLFAPRLTNELPQRSLLGVARGARDVTLEYKDDGFSRLQVAMPDAEEVTTIEAWSFLPHAVYSHLNSFCELHISGSGRLALSFSPCPDIIEMKPSDYPVGRPARLAYWDAENRFHVVEAHSGEKGPFKELAQGVLKKDEPLQITVHVDKKAVCRITFADWASQASRQLSPTAGWGLPENAIEFSLSNNGVTNQGVIYMTLAGTSTGRGWDSVGHAPGTYRNAVNIEPVPQSDQDRAFCQKSWAWHPAFWGVSLAHRKRLRLTGIARILAVTQCIWRIIMLITPQINRRNQHQVAALAFVVVVFFLLLGGLNPWCWLGVGLGVGLGPAVYWGIRQDTASLLTKALNFHRPRRNSPCPCGSGKKYKRCCLRLARQGFPK